MANRVHPQNGTNMNNNEEQSNSDKVSRGGKKVETVSVQSSSEPSDSDSRSYITAIDSLNIEIGNALCLSDFHKTILKQGKDTVGKDKSTINKINDKTDKIALGERDSNKPPKMVTLERSILEKGVKKRYDSEILSTSSTQITKNPSVASSRGTQTGKPATNFARKLSLGSLYINDKPISNGRLVPRSRRTSVAQPSVLSKSIPDQEETGDKESRGVGSAMAEEEVVQIQELRKKDVNECCRMCATDNHPIDPEHSTKCDRCLHAFMCPPHGIVGRWTTLLLMLLLAYGVVVSVLKEQALPGSSIFALFILLIVSHIFGTFVELFHCPSLLGMLISGVVLRNLPVFAFAKDISSEWSTILRTSALTVILTRAGLGLDPSALGHLSLFAVIRLSFTPCLFEAGGVAVAAKLIMGMPWTWALTLGFVMGAVSPAVVVPGMISLQEKGLGTDKGIPTLLIASSSIDDALAITGFGVALGFTFATGSLLKTILQGPLELILGVGFGTVVGLILWFLPHRDSEQRTLLRFMVLISGGLLCFFGSTALHLAGAGAVGCLSLAIAAGLGWRKQEEEEEEGSPNTETTVNNVVVVLWYVLQPLLFGLIGSEVDFQIIKSDTIGQGLGVLFCGLVVRCIGAFLAVTGNGFNLKEKLFVPLAWIPKATVQAALGSVALDLVRSQDEPDPAQEKLGLQILTVAVLAIMVSAPLGAIFINFTAPFLLKKTTEDVESEESESSPGILSIKSEY